ncbi:hypothetical protein GCM10025876_06250 [Demequina litorisediminis]|uniref:Uncharacterized protein n=1 Tax=Demequina litorisediminis TaxID=1849022 RepID=A0ABQ6I9M6_9MICO|nr:hypothetical protein GCM10025876_06250 [Demequina litorisediminis]
MDADAELLGVGAQGVDLSAAREVGDRLVDVERGGVVVLGRDREIGTTDRTAGEAQALEGLGARDLVAHVQINVDKVGRAVLTLADQVIGPRLLRERGSHDIPPHVSTSHDLRR